MQWSDLHARILKDVDYKRIFPPANTVFEARKKVKEPSPEDKEFMAFELVWFTHCFTPSAFYWRKNRGNY